MISNTTKKPSLHKIGAVSHLSGVPTPTLRIWETRYDTFKPHKTESKHRLYSDDDVLKATLLKRLTENGHSISSIARLSHAELNDLLQKQNAANPKIRLTGESGGTVSMAIVGLALAGRIESKKFTLKRCAMMVRREPISDADLADLINSLLLIDSTQMPSGLTPGVLIPPRKFNDMTLMRVAAISSSVLCECPRHVAEIIAQLASFEQYSHYCLNKSSEDAHLHAYLSSVSGSARALFESALEMVAKHEQFDLNGLSQ